MVIFLIQYILTYDDLGGNDFVTQKSWFPPLCPDSIFWKYFFISGRPDQVHNCTITNISMTSFAVKCSEGFNGGLPQSFFLEVSASFDDVFINYIILFTKTKYFPNTLCDMIVVKYTIIAIFFILIFRMKVSHTKSNHC